MGRVDCDTPLSELTVGQLRALLGTRAAVSGVRGVAELFGVSEPTARSFVNTWLKPACHWLTERCYVVDVDEALGLAKAYAAQRRGDGP